MSAQLSSSRLTINASKPGEGIVSFLDMNPYTPPAMPEIVGKPAAVSLVGEVKRKAGNDLILLALMSSVFAFFVPFGLVLDFVSLLLLTRVVFSRSKPEVAWMVAGVFLAIWNILRLTVVTFVLSWILFQ